MPSPYPEKVKRARELWARGYTVSEIAARIHVKFQTAKRYVDPVYDEMLREKEKERKKRYAGKCAVCGKPTSYSGRGRIGSQHCAEHAPTNRIWTREKIIDAIQRWAEIHGRPPTSVDWNAALAKKERGADFPSSGAVYGPSSDFACWADAIEAAGFPRPATRYSGEWGKMTWTKDAIIDALQAHAEDGIAPAVTEWAHSGPGHPTSSWVAIQFGSWTNACHAAGLQSRRQSRKQKAVATSVPQQLQEERIAFVKRVMDDQVPRQYIVQVLWRTWGFVSARSFRRWLTKNGIGEVAGYYYRSKRQLTREEFAEAQELALPPAVQQVRK